MTLVIPRRLKAFQGVSAENTATVQITGGPTYHQLVFWSNIPPAKMPRVYLTLNGIDIISVKAADLVMLGKFRKRYETQYRYVLYLADKVNLSLESRSISALVTFPTDLLTLSIDLGDALPGGAYIKGKAEVSASQQARVFVPLKYRTNYDASATAENNFDTFQRGPAIQRLHFESANISRLMVYKDKLLVWDRDADENIASLKEDDRAPQPGWFHFDAIQSDFGIADLFQTKDVRESLEFKFDISAVANVPILVEALKQEPPQTSQQVL